MQASSRSLAALCALAPVLSCAAGQTSQLPPIVVTASRVAQTADQTLASVTVIDRQDIERAQVRSVSQLLQGLPGINLANNGGPGKLTTVSLRGAESDHVLVLIDGVKVGSASAGIVAFEHLPAEQIERIEIVRGPRSSLYGSEAIGGVIQIFTRRGGGDLAPSLSLGTGSRGTFEAAAALTGGSEDAWFSAAVSGETTDGFNACRGEPMVAGCFTIEPDNDGYQNLSGNLRAGMRLGDLDLDAHWLRIEADSDYDGSFQNHSETVQQVLGADLNYAPGGAWSLTAKLGRNRDESDNFKDERFSTRFETRRDSASVQGDLRLGGDGLLTLGMDYQDERVGGSTAYTVTERDNTGVFGQFIGHYDGHDIQAGLRHDDNQQFGSQATGSLAWGYDLTAGMRLTAAYGTAFKAPTFDELYFPGFGNPDLDPEESDSIEIGLAGTRVWGAWSVNAYQSDIDHLIAFDADTYAPANVESARIRGLEANLRTELAGWRLSTALNLMDPVNRGDGPNRDNTLPRRARQALRLDFDRDFGRFSLGATLNAVGRRYDDLANRRELDGYLLVDLRGEYRLSKTWRVQGRIENLLDQDYETAAYYNQPGRGLFLTLRYRP